jgi:DNA polymerase-1
VSNDNDDSSKSPKKSEDQFDLLEVEFRWIFRRNHKYYKTLQDTEHSYQIIQGDLGWSYYYKLIKTKSVCFDWNYWTRCLACRVSRISFFMRRERILRTLSENQKQSTRWKIYAFFENEKSRKWTEFEIWFKILSNYA